MAVEIALRAAILAYWVGCGDAEIDGSGALRWRRWRDGRAGARELPSSVLTSARNRASRAYSRNSFRFRWTAPRPDLSTHGSELWISLGRTRVAIPPRPLFGSETPPISSVRANPVGQAASRIIVEVIGKSDYAIARLRDRNEIVLRVATTGADPNIAAPIVVHNIAPRRSAYRSLVRSPSRHLKIHAPFLLRHRLRPRPSL